MKRIILSVLSIAILSLFLVQCSDNKKDISAGKTADYLFTNAKVYTVNQKQPWAEAVAVKGKEIIFVGNTDQALTFKGSETKVIDLNGKMLLPGFIDAHAHPVMAAAYSGSLILDPEAEIKDWISETEKYIKENPNKPYYVAFGFLAAKFGAEGPKKELLDAVSTKIPVVLIDEGWHSAWVNSKALELAGIDKNTPDPIPGKHFYKRDQKGNPTGWCVENNSFAPILKKLKIVSTDNIVLKSKELFDLFSSVGITGFYDAGMTGFEEEGYSALQKLESSGKLPFRITGSYGIQSKTQLKDAVEKLRGLNKKFSSELIHPNVMKIHNDGTVEAFTAYLFEDYKGQKGNRGAILLEGDLLKDFVTEVDRSGFDIHIHAIGDKAINEALNAFEAAKKANPESKNRYTIAHNQMIIDSDLPRYGEIGVIAQCTPYWFFYLYEGPEGSKIDFEPTGDRANKYNRFRSVQKNGGMLTFGSDFPATGSLEGMHPLSNIEIGITRKPLGLKDAPTTPPADETLTLETMIRGYTIDAAYQVHLQEITGSIETGKKADLVILEKNLFDLQPYEIHNTRVMMTMMNGNVTFDRNLIK